MKTLAPDEQIGMQVCSRYAPYIDNTIYIGLYDTSPALQNRHSRILLRPRQVSIKPPYQLLIEFIHYITQLYGSKFSLIAIRKELHVSDSEDLFRSGVQINSGPHWSWYSSDTQQLVGGKHYWLFADVQYNQDGMNDGDMEMQEVQLKEYSEIMKPSYDYTAKMAKQILAQQIQTFQLFSNFSQYPLLTTTIIKPHSSFLVPYPTSIDLLHSFRLRHRFKIAKKNAKIKKLERRLAFYQNSSKMTQQSKFQRELDVIKEIEEEDSQSDNDEQEIVKKFKKMKIAGKASKTKAISKK